MDVEAAVFTTRQAAEAAGLPFHTMCTWLSRGFLGEGFYVDTPERRDGRLWRRLSGAVAVKLAVMTELTRMGVSPFLAALVVREGFPLGDVWLRVEIGRDSVVVHWFGSGDPVFGASCAFVAVDVARIRAQVMSTLSKFVAARSGCAGEVAG